MEPQGSLMHLQVSTTWPSPEPDQSSICPPSHFLEIHFSINLPSMPGSSKWSHSIRFPHQIPVCTTSLDHRCYVPAHLILLDLITWIIFGDKYTSLNTSLCSLFHSPVTWYLLGPNNLLSFLFYNNLSLCSTLIVSNQVSHSYKTTGKTIVLYILIF